VAAVRRDDDVVKRSTRLARGDGGTAALLNPDRMQIRAQSIDPSSLLPTHDTFHPSSAAHLHARATHFARRRTALDVAIGNIRNRPRVWLSNAQDARRERYGDAR
jgi:hypothetical protein